MDVGLSGAGLGNFDGTRSEHFHDSRRPLASLTARGDDGAPGLCGADTDDAGAKFFGLVGTYTSDRLKLRDGARAGENNAA